MAEGRPLFRKTGKGKKTVIFVGMEGWSKKGGQGDYVRELAAALADDGHVAIVINPYFRDPHADISADQGRELFTLELPVGQGSLPFRIFHNKIKKVHYIRFLDPFKTLFPVVYPDWYVDGALYSDSVYGYIEAVVLSRIPMHIAGQLGLRPDVIHFNDWQAAYGPPYMEILYRHHPEYKILFKKTGTVLTIHNMAYQGLTKWGLYINKQDPVTRLLSRIYPEGGLYIGVFDHGHGFELDAFGITGFPRYFQSMVEGGAECWSDVPGYGGRHNVLKFGIERANRIVAVSRGNRDEIQRGDLGFGLGGLISKRLFQGAVAAVWNGVDTKGMNPGKLAELTEMVDADKQIGFTPFRSEDEDLFEKRAKNRNAIRMKINKLIRERPGTCYGRLDSEKEGDILVSGVSRLVRQKGYGILFEHLDYSEELGVMYGERLIDVIMRLRSRSGNRAQLVIMGTPGDGYGEWVAHMLKTVVRQYEGQLAFLCEFDSKLANQIRSGTDIFFMPSQYEPGGISNIQAAVSGALCVIPYTGGLIDFFESGGTHPEFVCSPFNYDLPWTLKQTGLDFIRSFKRAIHMYYEEKDLWHDLVRRAMTLKVDWSFKIPEYLDIYDAAQRAAQGGH